MTPPSKKINIREKAAQIIALTEEKDSFADILLGNVIGTGRVEESDRKLLTEIVYGTLRNKIRIDSIIYSLTDRGKKIDAIVLNILRITIYQLLFLDRVPDFAAINEAVNIIKHSKKKALAGFVNAVLRKAAKSRDALMVAPELNNANDIATFYSFPLWLAEHFIVRFGIENAKEYFEYTLTPPNLNVRRTYLATATELERSFDEDGVLYEKLEFPDGMYAIKPGKSIAELKSYNAGYFIIQDPASALVVDILNPQKGEIIIDLCAAPGTKTIAIAEKGGERACVIATDKYQRRLTKLTDNLSRFKLKNIIAFACDATNQLPLKEGFLADRILIDAPCSGIGIVRKNPDIKYKVTPESVRELSEIQYKILTNAACYLKSGGRIVYSACTTMYEENEGVVKKFLENNSNFVLEGIDNINLKKNNMIDENGFFRTIPHVHHTDGFFAALFVRKK